MLIATPMRFHSVSKTPIIITISVFTLIGFSLQEDAISRTRALFNTKAEAQAAAKEFGCSGAHKMGGKWMPCQSHNEHQEKKKGTSHGHHHHHH